MRWAPAVGVCCCSAAKRLQFVALAKPVDMTKYFIVYGGMFTRLKLAETGRRSCQPTSGPLSLLLCVPCHNWLFFFAVLARTGDAGPLSALSLSVGSIQVDMNSLGRLL